jgi:hypothetical protein
MHPTIAAAPAPPAHPKKPWVQPAIMILPLRGASGATLGPKCDKYGSLSHGSPGCTQ